MTAVRGLANFDNIADSDQLSTDFKDGRLVITIQQADQARQCKVLLSYKVTVWRRR